MDSEIETFQHWDQCDDCSFQGLIEFRTRAEEDYEDADALGFVMDSTCPACGDEKSVLMVAEQFQEMVLLSTLKRTC
ncbi:MAG: hypothetical protein ACI8W7_004380 [Gammaproteobacteria bacterium]|jgi:hypothetical protein